jgi:hypothetical protein
MLTLQYAKDPVYGDDTGNCIVLIVKWEEFNEEMPFGATTYDPEAYGRDLHTRAKAGEFGAVAPYVVPTPTAEQNKATATSLLSETDWTSIADVADPAVSNPYLMNQSAFLAYRSQLREIAVNPTAGFITFPIKPQEQWSS